MFLCLKTKFKNHLNIIFIIIFLISIIATFYLKNDPHLSFYSPITRGWCFALGILAFLNKDKLQKFIILKLDNICLITIIICFFFFNNKTWHPSIFTLIPISCATYLILSKNNQTTSYKVLTNKFSLKIGIISYSLYLWHFPIISFHRHLYIENHISSVLSIIFFTILFSLASYNFIEKYFRSKKFNENIIFLIFLISLLFTFNIWLKKNNFYEYNTPKKLRFDELQDLKLMMDKKLCMDNECIFNPNYKKKIYLIGDSVFEDISVKLLPKLEKNKYNINTYFKSGCFLFPDHNKINIYTNKVEKNCSKNEQIKILNILEKTENSIIIFHARYALYLLEKEFNNNEGGIEKVKWEYKFLNENKESNHFVNFSKFVKKISKKNKIILIYPLPEVGWDLPRRVKFIEFKNKLLNDNKQVTTSYEIFKERNKEVFKILDNIKGPNIQRLYPHKKLCDYMTGRCITQKDNHLLYRDYVHLTKHGVKLILNDLLKLIENKN